MGLAVDLAKFGIKSDGLAGTVVSQSLTGRRLLFLFGERHTIRAGIKAHLLNALRLYDQGAISCVGVEGWKDPTGPVPCDMITEIFNSQKAQHGENEAATVEAIVRDYGPNNYVFWKTLTLLRPKLAIRSVEDPKLFHRAGFITATSVQDRIAVIATFLRQSKLPFSQHTILPRTPEQEDTIIECKAMVQGMEEFGESELNYQRDEAFLANIQRLWGEVGPEKAAILNAGVSHQYRIARQLRTNPAYRDEYSYVLIEQP